MHTPVWGLKNGISKEITKKKDTAVCSQNLGLPFKEEVITNYLNDSW
jgi:hypothetical protein